MFKIFTLHISFFLILISNLLLPHSKNIECSICELKINDQNYLLDIWGNPFHLNHKEDGRFCECCSRIISQKITSGGYRLDDGRYICRLCDVSIIQESMIGKSLDNTIKTLYRNGLKGLDVSQIEINIVDKNKMKSLYGSNASNHLKGITKISVTDDKIFKIYILNNIPEIQFEATLAHELMHVWLYKNNINLEHEKMEAFCNLGSYIIYKKDDTRFSNIHIMSLEKNNDQKRQTDIYKLLNSLMKKKSFNYILKNIKTIDIQ